MRGVGSSSVSPRLTRLFAFSRVILPVNLDSALFQPFFPLFCYDLICNESKPEERSCENGGAKKLKCFNAHE